MENLANLITANQCLVEMTYTLRYFLPSVYNFGTISQNLTPADKLGTDVYRKAQVQLNNTLNFWRKFS